MKTNDLNGINHPSVSTILKATQSPESLVALSRWRKKIGNDRANQIVTNRRRLGEALHQLIKEDVQGKSPVPCNSIIKHYWYSIQSVLTKVSDVQLVETVVPNYVERYVGKVDLVASYQGVPHFIEWVTAEEPKLNLSKLYDKPLQLVAYGGAINRYYGNSLCGSKISQALIVVALPDRDAEIFQLDRDRIIQYWLEWRHRLDLFYSNPETSELFAS